MLSRPRIDFAGGELYLTDPSPTARGKSSKDKKIPWTEQGELIVFAANATAGHEGGRPWYHGIREVRKAKGSGEGPCAMLAIGLLE